MINKNIFLVILLFGILSLTFVSAYTSSTPQLSQYGITTADSVETSCTEGTDFIMQIEPFGCTPAVIRTDLLEETNVPVFCKLAVTKINPLVNVNFIESVSITGNLSPYVSGVAFYPARAALNTGTSLSSSVLENVGYVVINVKKQTNASAIPEVIYGNLTASITYDIDEALGLGNGIFYLSELNEEEWEAKKSLYQFWGGKGYLKVEDIDSNEATISLYDANKRISSTTLKKGETSNTVYIPGVSCNAGVNLKLVNVENPTTRAQLNINSEIIEVGDEEKFLDNKCTIKDISKSGLVEKVSIKCQEDEATNTFDLIISPKILLEINGESKEVGVGDYLYDDGTNGVYLGYLGTKDNSRKLEDVFIYLVSMPKTTTGTLTEAEISSLNFVVGDLIEARQEGSGIIDSASDLLKGIAGWSNRLSRFVAKEQKLYRINFGETTSDSFGKQVSVINYAGSTDAELASSYKDAYENAQYTYETIIDQFASEIFSDSENYGEKALYSEIALAYHANQKNTAAELCDKFENTYPDSLIDIPQCDWVYKLSSENSDERSVIINSRVKTISLLGIYEPAFEDYGVGVTVTDISGRATTHDLTKDKIVYLDGTGGNYMQLISATDNTAQIKTSIDTAGVMDAIAKEFGSDTIKLEQNVVKDLAGYSVNLDKVNLKKSAKVSLTSSINNAGTKANFSFQVGIEKRAISLSPDKIKETLEDLNKSIEKWEKVSGDLGKVVTGLKTSCLATGILLITKNFIAGLGNAGIARQYVMRGTDGWFEKCTDAVNQGTYVSVDGCLAQNSDSINKDVSALTKIINEQNNGIEDLEKGVTTNKFLADDIINNDAFMEKYTVQVNNEISSNSNIPSTITDPTGKGKSIDKAELLAILSYEGWKNNYYTTGQLRNIELYSEVLNDPTASDDLKKTAQAELYSEVSDIKATSQDFASRSELANGISVDTNKIISLETNKDTKKLSYTGLTNKDLGSKKITSVSDNNPVAIVQTFPDGKQYIVILDNSAGSSKFYIKNVGNQLQIYDYNDLTKPSTSYPKELANVYFERYDSSSYKNVYKNPELSYYETEPYKGLPAIVPFNLNDGWYSATKQTLPVGGNIQTYDASGKVNSFYLCNVGSNGLEEFSSSNYGDDECILMNTGTGQPYDQVPGLSENDAEKYVKCAIKAIEQAANLYPASGKVSINTACGNAQINVGEPAVDVPEFTCQDFMSPDECLLLFNLCDPVICPSSRCDFGGAYPVSNVVQTGIIGSIALCLPNIREGIFIPVCLTGILSGIDSWLSVQKAYRDCLQESLDTGKMVGICDEMYSIYICDFFWEQALPLADIVIPKLIESLLGQNVRGGGEYLSVEDSFANTEKALNYFTDYYGANVKEAFTTRTKEVIQNEVCKTFVSGVAPSGADLIDGLTEADSPVQFYGKFEENSLTTATVPALSHYKVFYHIYAGENAGAYYQVYLKGSTSSSYYQNTQSAFTVASGYVNIGGYVDESPDFTATSGYDQLCISINGQEECGFKSVTTSFAINYAKDEYLSEQATTTEITSQSECVSGTTSLYSILNLNLQSAAGSLIDPAIYTQGIVRTCATSSPGKSTDPNFDNQDARWIDVGYCSDENIRCWIDTDSVKDVIRTVSIENETLNSLSATTIEALQSEGGYLSDSEFSSVVKEIEGETDSANKIVLVDNIFEKAFWSYQKANLLLLKGNAYFDIFLTLYAQNKPATETTGTETQTVSTEGDVTPTTTTGVITADYNLAISNVDINTLTTSQKSVLSATKNLVGKSASRTTYKNCWDAAYQSYRDAKVGDTCVYSDTAKKSYTIENKKCLSGDCKSATITTALYTGSGSFPTFAVYGGCGKIGSNSENEKLSALKTGDMISYVWRDDSGHSAIFIGWKDKTNGIAYLFDWNGFDLNGNYIFRYYAEDLSDDKHPVYVCWSISGAGATSVIGTISNLPANTQEDFIQTIDKPDFSTTSSTGVTTTSTGESGISPTEENADIDLGTISNKIFTQARIFLNQETGVVKFIRNTLFNAGVSEIVQINRGDESATMSNLQSLIDELDSNNNFVVLNTGVLQSGDIVFLGKGCSIPYSVGIFAYSDGKNSYYYSTQDANSVSEVKELKTNSVFAVSNNIFIYKAYRYVGDSSVKTVTQRTIWNVDSAIEEIETLTGRYSANKQLVDNFIFDGIFTEEECKRIIPTNVFGFNIDGGETMSNIRDILLVKETVSGGAH
jgi:hypothetical protein